MGKLINQCPSCGSGKVKVVKIDCTECDTKFEGSFDIPPILKLPSEDLSFILDFVKCSGSLKEMAGRYEVSYPTLRNRLNALIESLQELDRDSKDEKDEILSLLEAGKISAAEAAKRLRKL